MRRLQSVLPTTYTTTAAAILICAVALLFAVGYNFLLSAASQASNLYPVR
jgi:hypothetical protein